MTPFVHHLHLWTLQHDAIEKLESQLPIIKFHGHHHPMVFIDETSIFLRCRLCGLSIEGSVFYCKHCSYCLDLSCGPIPCTIKSRHMHTLDLCDYYLEDDTGEDSCDVCEKRRDPQKAVCLCHLCEDQGCAYVAEIECVMSEVLRALRGDLGVVELRTVRTRIPGKVIPISVYQQEDDHELMADALTREEEGDDATNHINQLWVSMTEDEKRKLEALCEDMDKSLRRGKNENPSDEMQCSDEGFKLLMESLDYSPGVLEAHGPFGPLFPPDPLSSYAEWWLIQWRREWTSRQNFSKRPFGWLLNADNASKLVNVKEGHEIPRAFESIYRVLLDKYGDVSEGCEISVAGKSVLFALFLQVIAFMSRKQLSRISESDLRVCHYYLKYLRLVGFKIQFAFENLKKLAGAYFGLQFIKFEQDRLKYLNQQVAQRSKAIEEQEAELQAVRTKQEEHMRHMKVKKSSLMDECLSEARALKYKVGWQLLF